MMRWFNWAYESVMAALALAVVWLLTMPDQGWVRVANLMIWVIFVVDYGVRLIVAPDRWRFIRLNIPDLIATMPLDYLRVFRLARLARLVRVVRAATVLWRVSKDVRGIVGTNGLGYVLLCTIIVVMTGGIAIWVLEPGIQTLGDGVWWSIVTTTTVGYGDISPATPVGRVVAVLLMVVGIGTLGMITGSIATYFIGLGQPGSSNPHVQHIEAQLKRWDMASPEERRCLAALLMALAVEDTTNSQRKGGEIAHEVS